MQWKKAHMKGNSFPVVISIGVDPSITLAATAPFTQGSDEIAMAGALRRAPIEMVRCETIPLEVPATTEWVLEGEIKPNTLRMEGPFGEGAGYYGEASEKEFIEIKTITYRNNAVNQGAPIYNRGHHAACADIYEVAAMRLMKLSGDQMPESARTALHRAMVKAEHCRCAASRAWALRHGLDAVYMAMSEIN